eukprot:Phypoly_transcript_08480.p1 GENE.Phypoly_transcript_08480~~Phypoly_transcript_08480.p1  ORF type:complete len:399 (-),score=115.21 Phypoly_transcript_08480:138-1334(-)
MAAIVNIPRDVKDEFYRYKMPSIIAKVEGKGNGIKTVIVNMADVSKSLARPPAYPTKFFGFELGAITTIDATNDKYIVNGKHDQPKLMQVLDDFIEKFILCKKCERNPETYLVIKGGLIELKCKACGGRTPVDMRHKLCTFILKNPPPEEKKIKRSRNKEEDGAEQEADETNGKEEEKAASGKKSSRKKKQQEEEDDDDVVWHTDTSKEAVEQRRKEMLQNTSELAAKLLNTDINDRPDPLVSMHELLKGNPKKDKILAQLQKEREEHKLDDEQTARLAVLALFDANIFKQIKTDKLDIIRGVVKNTAGQTGILGGLTELGKDPAVLKVVPHVLKYLYDEDVLEEEAIMKWHSAKSKGDAAKVKEAAKVFVAWLETAEEEDEDDEEEDDDEEEEEDSD